MYGPEVIITLRIRGVQEQSSQRRPWDGRGRTGVMCFGDVARVHKPRKTGGHWKLEEETDPLLKASERNQVLTLDIGQVKLIQLEIPS